MSKNYLQAIPLSSIDSSTFTGGLQVLNIGLLEACSLIRIINDSNVDISISYDNAHFHDYLRSGSTLELNIQTNSLPNGYVSLLKKGTPVYVAGASGTGFVYLAGYYNPN